MTQTTTLELRRTVDVDGVASFDIPEEATDAQRDLLAQYLQPATQLWDIAGMPPSPGRPAPQDDSVISLVGVIAYDDYVKDASGQFVVDEETGALKPCTTTRWLTSEGLLYFSHSPAAADWVKSNLLKLYGGPLMGSLRKVVRVRVEKRKTATPGRFTFQFRYMPDTVQPQ